MRKLFGWCAAMMFVAPLAAMGQEAQRPAGYGEIPILIVDRERALRDSAPAEDLAIQEREARSALQAELDRLRRDLEAEEAEIAAMREIAPKEAFEARVRAFDARVRDARRESQAKGEAVQARFLAARRELAAALEPVLQQMLEETGATLIVDARTVLAARPGADVTEKVMKRFNLSERVSLPTQSIPGPAPDPPRE
ncbi:MAG: OmpH family outer membrane protein [Paracoccaceae bacterium]